MKISILHHKKSGYIPKFIMGTFIIILLMTACSQRDYQQLTPFGLSVPDNGLRVQNVYPDRIEITWDAAVSTVSAPGDLVYALYLSQNSSMNSIKEITDHGTVVDSLTGLSSEQNSCTIPSLSESTRYYINIIVSDTDMKSLCYNRVDPLTASSSYAQSRDSISQFGVTWTFDRDYTCGRYANGDWWVTGPVNITGIFPPSYTAEELVEGEPVTITRNGSMLNPSPRNGATQGYDSRCGGNEYVESLNVAPGVSAEDPLDLPAGSSLVSSISRYEEDRQQLLNAAVLTVVSAGPPQGSFRPPYSGCDKTSYFNISQLNHGLLEDLAPVTSAPELSYVERLFERPWIDHIPGWGSRSIHPAENMINADYGREMSSQIGAAALMLHLDFPDEEKETLLIRFVQLGIDFYGIVQDGGEWPADGGHMSGRKWPILFSGLMLGDPGMTAIGDNSGDYLYENGHSAGNPPTDYISFGEDDQTFHITQEDIDRELVPNWLDVVGVSYEQTDLGLPEWGIRHAYYPGIDSRDWTTPYRQCCTAISWTGWVLAARIMQDSAGAMALWNHDALFDYQDRYMAVTAGDPDPFGFIDVPNAEAGWRTGGFVGDMWDEYRNDY